MTTTTPAPVSNPTQRTIHEPDAIVVWTMGIEAESDPRLLSRILQKLAVPEIELIWVNFAHGERISFVRLHLRCTGAWTQLTAGKLRRLVNVLSVAVRPL